MSLPQTTEGYAPGPDDGEALWFKGGLALLKAAGDQTGERLTAVELRAPKDFASPFHLHRNEDEPFLVLSGEVRIQHGESVVESVAGSLVHGARNLPHGFRVDSEEGDLLLIFARGRRGILP
jgi:quercetin dioxygenase-like cupin family protein